MGGIYRASCVSVLSSGRIEVIVPAVTGLGSLMAQPCRPVGSTDVPAVGAGVWVMFENGDPAHPVWLGTWMGG